MRRWWWWSKVEGRLVKKKRRVDPPCEETLPSRVLLFIIPTGGWLSGWEQRLPHHVTLSVLTSNSKVNFSFFLFKQITEKKKKKKKELIITRKQNTESNHRKKIENKEKCDK
jgi:hypothetical protein